MPSTSGLAVGPAEQAAAAMRLSEAKTIPDVIRAVVDHAAALHNLNISGYAIEDGICVLLTSNGPVDTSVVARAVTNGEPTSQDGVLAVPVLVDDAPVAVLSSAARIAGEAVQPFLEFLADVAATSVSRLRAMHALRSAGLLGESENGATTSLSYPTPFRELFDVANLMLAVCDAEGRLVYVNPWTADFTGVDATEYIGQPIWTLPIREGLDPRPGEIKQLGRRLAQGHATHGELDVKDAAGNTRMLQYELSPSLDANDELQYVLVSGIDVTDQHKAQEAMRATADALSAARTEAEKSAAARSDFLTSMSHEIRTPLNAIIGTSTLLLDREKDDLTNEHAEILRSSAEHLLSVINGILDMSKLESDQVEIDDNRFAVETLVESSLDLVMGVATSKGLEVTSIVEPGTPEYLYGDAPRVRQVLVNLLSNAVKYTDEGVVELIGRGHYVGVDRVELVFEVRDTGPGIAPRDLEHLFEPFMQAEAHRNTGLGTGLGLSISERLVKMMGGTITVQSTVGVGTTFTVSIPFDVDTSVHALPDAPEPADLSGLAVLIVDDIEINRRVLDLETKRWGMVPTLCASPLDALALVDGGRRFDLALLDLNMPDMRGDELAEALRARHPCPMVLLSSTDFDDNTRLFGARLHKPIKRHQLSSAIEQALGHATPTTPVPSVLTGEPQPLRILVAEDNVVNQKVARALLSRLGHEPDIVGDGIEVMKVLDTSVYDLILLDLRMPGIDGIEAATQIIERFGDERPRLVALTASATEDDRLHCLEAGMDDFVTKPVTLDSLARVVADTERSAATRTRLRAGADFR